MPNSPDFYPKPEVDRSVLLELFEKSPAFMAVLRGEDHVFELVNEKYLELVGHRDLIGKPVREAFPELWGQGYFELLDSVFRTGQPFVGNEMKVALQRAPGESPVDCLVEFVYQPLYDEGARISGVFVHGVDLTARRQAFDALQENEGKLHFLGELGEATRDLLDPERIMVVVARKVGERLKASRCAYADVDADSDHFTIRHDYTDGCASTVGKYALSLFGTRAAADQRAGRTLVICDVDKELPGADGGDVFNAIGIKAIICCPLVRAGRLLAMMAVHQTTPREWSEDEISLLEAVVERSWAYLERARAMRDLAQNEALFRQLADAMPQIVFMAQADGHVDYFNRKWYEYTGLIEGAVGYESWKDIHEEHSLHRITAVWNESLRTGKSYEIEYRLRRADGSFRWHLGRALPVKDKDGKIVRWFGTNTDIHDSKELHDQNARLLDSERAARGQAELTSRMKDEFLATLSHELRTPLNAILGWATILRSGGPNAPDFDQAIQTIERNARAQTQIIEDLLDMSRIISGKVRLDVQRVDLAEIISEALQTVETAANSKGIRIQAVLDPLAGPVSGDPNRLQQVLWNLFSNAIKFTDKGGRVQVLLERVDSHVEISVIDTGHGITPEFLPNVFNRFEQADSSSTRRFGGLGLGLAIVKQLVELHGGSVRAKSAGLNAGSTFIVALPLLVIHSEKPDGDRRHPRTGESSSLNLSPLSLEGVRVLVVDDEPDARSLVKRLLEQSDAKVEMAGSSLEGVRALQGADFDVLISDIGMPGEDGYSLIKRVRELEDTRRHIPAIALTAYARSEDRTHAIRAGFQMHLAKPVEPAELIAVVGSLAGRTYPR